MNRFLRRILFVVVVVTVVFALSQTALAFAAQDVFVTTEGVNLRSSASTASEIMRTIPQGTTVTVMEHDPAGWTRVRVNGSQGFIRSDFLTFQESHAPVTFRTTSGVNLRSAPNTDASVLRTISLGSAVDVLTHDPAGWSSVRVNGTVGFVRSDLLMLPTTGNQQPANSAPTHQSVEIFHTVSGVNFRANPSTEADILSVLNTGTRVEVLGNGANGWSEVRVNGDAGFIRSDLLSSEPVSTPRVELLSVSEVRNLIPINRDIMLTDVRTGRTFNIRAFSIGRHADVETSTQRDTDIKFSIREGRWSWAARPVWVHLGDRVIAASINGMPHAGDFIPGNGMNGHLCLHFHGTITNNQRYQADLRNAIQEAYNAGRNR